MTDFAAIVVVQLYDLPILVDLINEGLSFVLFPVALTLPGDVSKPSEFVAVLGSQDTEGSALVVAKVVEASGFETIFSSCVNQLELKLSDKICKLATLIRIFENT